MPGTSRPSKPALVLRTIALFFILYQFRLLAGDLSDTAVFVITLILAFFLGFVLSKKSVAPVPSVIIIVLVPVVTKLLLALPGIFILGPAPLLDSLEAGFDRNNFVAIIPFYWASVTSYFSYKSRNFLRGDIVASFTLLIIIYSIAKTEGIELFRLSVLKIGLFALIAVLLVVALLFTLDRIYKLKKKEAGLGIGAIFLLAILASVFLLGPSQDRAVSQGGGLVQPKFLKFDFSQILRLESEISLNDDLVLIVKKSPDDFHVLLRRYILSGYSNKTGFYLKEGVDDKEHPPTLPTRPVKLDADAAMNSFEVDQEYFLVNFDASAFIALNQPVEITPYQSWDASSFNSAYAVKSLAGDFYKFEILDSVQEYPDMARLGLSEEDFALYTDFGNNRRIQEFARELTRGVDNYWDKIQIIYDTLKYGDYRYSLKAGIAPDGDQLGHFLFESKRGYCSYFAFSMALMLRSLGIPARVAVGFSIDPDIGALDYYPVRSDMAHAWVEVRFPGYGWVEYDPTTPSLAEGEEFRFDSGVKQDLFERLMKEILQNRSKLTIKEGGDENGLSVIARLGKESKRILQEIWPALLVSILVMTNIIIRAGNWLLSVLYRNPRKKSYALWKHILRRMGLIGCGRKKGTPEADWAKAADNLYSFELYNMYNQYSAARFAEVYTVPQHETLRGLYKIFSFKYGMVIPAWQRLLAWLFPWIMTIIYSGRKSGVGLSVLILCGTFLLFQSDSLLAQESNFAADSLLMDAMIAEDAENWDRAIELYSQGTAEYPNDYRFSYSLGSLYSDKQLYHLAWEEYRRAEKIIPYDTNLLYSLAWVAGYLNEDKTSASYLERLLLLDPEDKTAIGDLAWMYYKLHRLEDGLNLLVNAIDMYGPDYRYSMTLGAICSELFRYDEAKEWYLDAISGGEASNSRSFTAVANYNLSILEFRFYQFADALDRANESLRWADRFSGRLSRGELYLRQLDFSRAFTDYREAYELDESSLSKVSLAQAYQISGRLDEARLYAEDTLLLKDLSWMVNFGTTPSRYKKEIYEILYNTYSGLREQENFRVYGNLKEKLQSAAWKIIYSFKTEVNKHLYRKYSLIVADSYAEAGQSLEASLYYYTAFMGNKFRANRYLQEAREFETGVIPESLPSYIAEDAILFKKTKDLPEIINTLDALWERDIIADSYSVIAQDDSWGNKMKSYDAAERLFALNRGALLQNGIRLPVDLSILNTGAGSSLPVDRLDRRITSIINKSGFNSAIPANYAARYRLTITLGGTYTIVKLEDSLRGSTIINKDVELRSASSEDVSKFVRTVSNLIFTVN